MQQVKTVIARAEGEPVEFVTINVPNPGPGEAVVKVASCGAQMAAEEVRRRVRMMRLPGEECVP